MTRPNSGPKENQQLGTVLVFRPGVTQKEAEEALKKLREVLQYEPNLHSFNPEWGGPVWYIP